MRRTLQILGLILFSLINVKAKVAENRNGVNGSVQASGSANLFWNSTNFNATHGIYDVGSVNYWHRGYEASSRYVKTSSARKVTFSSVKVANRGNCNRIDWKIESEAANASYILEHSNDGRNYVVINTIYSQRTPALYFMEVTPKNDISHYSLKKADVYGTVSYSEVVKAKSSLSITAYPSPVSEILSVNIKDTHDHTSRVVTTDIAGKFISKVEISGLSTDIYMTGVIRIVHVFLYTYKRQSYNIKVQNQ